MVKDSKILILGITFKENCPDIRNTKVVDIYHTLMEYTNNITVYDPWANVDAVNMSTILMLSMNFLMNNMML